MKDVSDLTHCVVICAKHAFTASDCRLDVRNVETLRTRSRQVQERQRQATMARVTAATSTVPTVIRCVNRKSWVVRGVYIACRELGHQNRRQFYGRKAKCRRHLVRARCSWRKRPAGVEQIGRSRRARCLIKFSSDTAAAVSRVLQRFRQRFG